MIKIRMSRGGRANLPDFTIVASDSRFPRDGKFFEKLGKYNPKNEKEPFAALNLDKMADWIKKGAQLSESIRSLFKKHKIKIPV